MIVTVSKNGRSCVFAAVVFVCAVAMMMTYIITAMLPLPEPLQTLSLSIMLGLDAVAVMVVMLSFKLKTSEYVPTGGLKLDESRRIQAELDDLLKD